MNDTDESKYWIKAGVVVENKNWPGIKMVVDDIKRYTKEMPAKELDKESGLKKIPQQFIKGVECHWLTKDQIFQKGLFQTTELREWPKKESS